MTRSAPRDTKSLSTFPSGILALGCGPSGPLWRLDRSRNWNRNPSHLIPSNKSSVSNYLTGAQPARRPGIDVLARGCRKMSSRAVSVRRVQRGATDEDVESSFEREAFRGRRRTGRDGMTLQGTVNKTGLLLLCAIASAAWTWHLFNAVTFGCRCPALAVDRDASADLFARWLRSSRRSGLR